MTGGITGPGRAQRSEERPRRALLLALGCCTVGSTVVLLTAGRPWATLTVEAAPGLPRVQEPVTGSELAAPLAALGLVGLASVAALLAARGRARATIGSIVVLVGLVVLAYAWVGASAAPDVTETAVAANRTAWPFAAAGGGALLVVGGALATLRGRDWPALPGRYDRGDQTRGAVALDGRADAPSGRDAWDRLDRGQDPTA